MEDGRFIVVGETWIPRKFAGEREQNEDWRGLL
jgi:hypothetical protein